MSNDKIRLIIEIDKEVYEHVRDKKFFISSWVDTAIAQGTPLVETLSSGKESDKDSNNIITLCRKTAVEENLPLYFIYYEETGILDIYITKTNELFEKRRCARYLSNADFKEIVDYYLYQYPNWEGSAE